MNKIRAIPVTDVNGVLLYNKYEVTGDATNDAFSSFYSRSASVTVDLSTTPGDYTFRGGGGNDTIDGGAGNDLLYGDTGNDVFVQKDFTGNDVLRGGDGNDVLSGEDGDDVFLQDALRGNDILDGLQPVDTGRRAHPVRLGQWHGEQVPGWRAGRGRCVA